MEENFWICSSFEQEPKEKFCFTESLSHCSHTPWIRDCSETFISQMEHLLSIFQPVLVFLNNDHFTSILSVWQCLKNIVMESERALFEAIRRFPSTIPSIGPSRLKQFTKYHLLLCKLGIVARSHHESSSTCRLRCVGFWMWYLARADFSQFFLGELSIINSWVQTFMKVYDVSKRIHPVSGRSHEMWNCANCSTGRPYANGPGAYSIDAWGFTELWFISDQRTNADVDYSQVRNLHNTFLWMGDFFMCAQNDTPNRDTVTIDVPSKVSVYETYKNEMGASSPSQPAASVRLFYRIWHDLFPHVLFFKLKECR